MIPTSLAAQALYMRHPNGVKLPDNVKSVADPGGAQGGHGSPVQDKEYLLCTSWYFLVKKLFLPAKQ